MGPTLNYIEGKIEKTLYGLDGPNKWNHGPTGSNHANV